MTTEKPCTSSPVFRSFILIADPESLEMSHDWTQLLYFVRIPQYDYRNQNNVSGILTPTHSARRKRGSQINAEFVTSKTGHGNFIYSKTDIVTLSSTNEAFYTTSAKVDVQDWTRS